MSQSKPALAEMSRVLDRRPDASLVAFPGDVRVTRAWSHGELHDDTRPMREHVLMTYYGSPRGISRHDGRVHQSALTRPGTVTIIPAGHAAKWDIDGEIEVSHVYLPPLRLLQAAEGARPVELLDRLAVEDATLAHLLAVIARESQAQDAGARLLVEQALDLVVLQIGRRHAAMCGTPARAPRGGLAAWQVRRVTEYMAARLAETVTLDELAALVDLSRFHFCAAFHLSMGAPPHKWLRALRMNEAKRLLLHTRMPIIDIALSVGYETPSAFAKAFKAAEGVNPAALRRQR